jgi:oligoribonuclease NrnB/cAMP/cGMP phosphodiesterase (DHH superfamily)
MKYPEARCESINYGRDFPWKKIKSTDFVFMVDFGLQPFSDMERLNGMCNLIWIDHHKTAIESESESDIEIDGLRVDGQAGCELTWKYLFPNKSLPRHVKLLADFDVWRNDDKERWNNEIEPFQYAMRALIGVILEPGSSYWEGLEQSDKINQLIRTGKSTLKFLKRQYAEECERYSFEVEIEGLRAIVLNTSSSGSQNLESVYDEKKHDLMVGYRWTGSEYTYSLYSTKDGVDCGAIAKKHSGGGHKGAAGCTSKTLIW